MGAHVATAIDETRFVPALELEVSIRSVYVDVIASAPRVDPFASVHDVFNRGVVNPDDGHGEVDTAAWADDGGSGSLARRRRLRERIGGWDINLAVAPGAEIVSGRLSAVLQLKDNF